MTSNPSTVPTLDLESAHDAAAQLLKALGVDIDAPATANTPTRMVAAYAELLSPRPFTLTTFANDAAYDRLVTVRAIPFRSLTVVSGHYRRPVHPHHRVVINPFGMGVHDIAIAAEVHAVATRSSVGSCLPR